MNPDNPENNNAPEAAPAPIAASAPQPRSVWARYAVIGAVALTAVGGIGLASAMSHGFGRGGPHHHWDQMLEYSRWDGMGFHKSHLDSVLEEIDATPEQAEKIKAIVTATRTDFEPLAEEMRGTRDQIEALLRAPAIDRAAAESLRAERVARVDEASRKLTAAVLDAAQVLTPEQRAELVDMMQERGKGRRW